MTRHRIAIVGAGIGGLGLAIGLRRAGIVDFVVLERSDGIGGTWRLNTYPGAACDVPSHLYSYSFAPNPFWSRAYAGQQEILDYLQRCADEADVGSHLRTGWEVTGAKWDDADRCWRVVSSSGAEVQADIVVFAVGLFTSPMVPDLEGIGDFEGPVIHSARWDHDVDPGGRRLGMIGSGASAVQILPEVAPLATRTSLFLRTPPYVVPRFDPAFSPEDQRRLAEHPEELAEIRHKLYTAFEDAVTFRIGEPLIDTIKRIALEQLANQVPDPELRSQLTPTYELGCKRILVSSDFYPAVVRDDVELVTAPIVRILPHGIETGDGTVHELDVIVLATGFRATEYLHGLEIVGSDGVSLARRWEDRPHAYLGTTVSEFPNMFIFYGPNTNQGGNSIILILEAQAHYVLSALELMDKEHLASVDVRQSVMEEYDTGIQRAMAGTVWASGCNSYFTDSQGRVVTQLPHTASWFAERLAVFDPDDYHCTPVDGRRTSTVPVAGS
ncbi:MAG: flavin-containing monooxygenase [Acidimicrobiales bacterium]